MVPSINASGLLLEKDLGFQSDGLNLSSVSNTHVCLRSLSISGVIAESPFIANLSKASFLKDCANAIK